MEGRADPDSLKAEEQGVRQSAFEAILSEHSQLIKQLVELAGQKVERTHPNDPTSSYPWRDKKHLSIVLLGDLRAEDAIPVLLENFEYENAWDIIGSSVGIATGGWHPAAEALSKIGMPAIGPTIDKLGSYDTDCLGRELCCWILKEILGVRLARLRLEIAIEETQDEAVKRNLSAAATLPHFKTPEEKAAEERARQKKDSG